MEEEKQPQPASTERTDNGTNERPDERTNAAVPEDIEQAKRLIEADRQRRTAACLAEIQEVLKKYNCDFTPIIQITAN